MRPLRVALALGTAAPVNALDYGIQLKTGYRTTETDKLIPRSDLEGGGFLAFFGIDAKAVAGPRAAEVERNRTEILDSPILVYTRSTGLYLPPLF